MWSENNYTLLFITCELLPDMLFCMKFHVNFVKWNWLLRTVMFVSLVKKIDGVVKKCDSLILKSYVALHQVLHHNFFRSEKITVLNIHVYVFTYINTCIYQYLMKKNFKGFKVVWNKTGGTNIFADWSILSLIMLQMHANLCTYTSKNRCNFFGFPITNVQ